MTGRVGARTCGALVAVLGLVLALGLAGLAQIAVTVTIKDTSDPACTGGTGICPEPSVVGQQYAVEFEVKVTGDNPSGLSPYGTVTVTDGTGASDSRTVSSGDYPNGWVWRCFLTSTSAGVKTITATFVSSDGNFTGASDTESHTVIEADTSVSITSSANPSVTGQSVTFTATVSAVSPGSGTPTGTVSFYAGGSLIATSSLSGGTATCSRAFGHIESPVAITARYNGDANYNPSDNTLNPLSQTVNKASTTTSITAGASSWLGEPYTVSGTVSVPLPGAGTPTGTVTVSDGAGASCAANLVAGAWSCSLTSSGAAGMRTLTAVYEGDENFAGSTGTTTHTVSKVSTTSAVTTAPNPSFVGEAVTITATVTAQAGGGSPTGVVVFSYGTTALGSAALGGSGTDQSKAVLVTTQIPLGTHTITATYLGEGRFEGSSATTAHTVQKRPTVTKVFGSDTALVVGDTVTATVTVSSLGSVPTGTVTVSVSPNDEGSPTSWSHTLVPADGGQFTFTYTPSSAETATHTLTATYAGDTTHDGSTGSFAQAILKRAADVQLVLNPSTAYIGQPVAVTVRLEDDTTAGTASVPTESITFGDGGKNGVFSSGSASLTGGTCTVTYTPGAGDAGTTTITASYSGSAVHRATSRDEILQVLLRPTETRIECQCGDGCGSLLVNQPCTYKVTVVDIAGVGTAPSGPDGLVSITRVPPVPGTATIAPSLVPIVGLVGSQGLFVYSATTLNDAAASEFLRADYAPVGGNDGVHASSAGGYIQPVQRRPTETTLNCTPTPTGVLCTVSVADKPGNPGAPTLPLGTYLWLEGNDGAGETVPSVFTVTSDFIYVNVSIRYESTDLVHLDSTASVLVDRSAFIPVVPPTPPSGEPCTWGCGSGGIDVEALIMGLNIAKDALKAIGLYLDLISIPISLIPEPIWGAGIGFVSGTTIPIKDIVQAVIDGAKLGLETAQFFMDIDWDGDGIPAVVELLIGTSDVKVDTDGDGLYDPDEISWNGGWFGDGRRPNPTIADSDGDGLSDGDEFYVYGTDPCVPDTDCDTVSDGTEVGTWSLSDTRNHADPLMQDTDGDGLRDDLEITAGCPFVNDDDSDDDGLQDGYEDRNRDGIITNTIGGSASQGSGETCFCTWDTDGDGLSDGEEEGLFGTLITPTGVSTTVGAQGPNLGATVPALDTDMDNDGLSDYAEANTYQTDPMDADTDNDTLSDGAEVATWADADARNHSNPREADTDGDGLVDPLEITLGCPFVNDDDSDDDGLQDGYEDRNRDGIITNTIGDSTTQGSGETCFCTWDTDDDGLSDGEEEALFGAGPITAVTRSGAVTTVAALDDDSDNDGLSDWEEVNVTGTNPLHWDTDGDGLSDADELIATGGAWPKRTFRQVSDPLTQDTDNDGLLDGIEWTGSGLGSTYLRSLGGDPDTACPFVDNPDSDSDGLLDGYEDKNKDGIWNNYQLGNSTTQGWGETCACNPDSDGDGLQDGEEEGLLGRTATPQDVSTVPGVDGAALSATTPALDDDSDNDGLSDWEEVNVTGTNPLDADTDNDTLSDADELIATGGAWPKRTFIQESDPLDADTDDDGLPDAIEYPGTGLGSTYLRGLGGNPDTICPFVNDDDSDDDGLQDGYEDKNKDGIWNNYQIGNSTTQGWGETCACNPDSDGDGLQDGEEEGLLGRTATPQGVSTVLPMGTSTAPPGYIVVAGSMRGTGNDLLAPYAFTPTPGPALAQTVPALDTDSDNDGLSDWEEVNVTGTDPLDADTDNDTLADADELIAVSGTWPNRQFDQVSDPLSTNTDGDHLFDPQEFAGSGLRALAGGIGGTRDLACPYVNDADSDDDGVQDGAVVSRTLVAAGVTYSWTHYEDFVDIPAAGVAWPGIVRTVVTPAGGEQNDDAVCNVCDPDSDGDGLLDGEEIGIGTDPGDWDTDDDGRNDWHEVTGGGPIPTDPFDPDTDDDGLLDSAEVFGSNPTNPANCDTDADGLCDGGARTPYMMSGHPSVVVNPRCLTGIGGHPNPLGIGENERGDGARHPDETDPNNPDTDGDAVGDGIERLSFSVSRQHLIPATDLFGRSITVVYPEANNVKPVCGCMDPLNPDSDGDGLLDGEEDLNHDGHFDFLVSDFDHGHHGPIPGPAIPHRMETNPCDPDTDHDGLTDWEELRGQTNPPAFFPFNPTNPLDHDTDNDWIFDGPEVRWVCTELLFMNLDNDGDGLIDEDPVDGIDNDGDGLIDEDDVDFYVRYVPVLDPTNRDSDSDGFIDGLDPDPCNSQPIPIVVTVVRTPVDTDGDGFADEDEIATGTDPHDPKSFPQAFAADLDLDGIEDDRLWLSDTTGDGTANTVTIDIDSNILIDIRVQIVAPRDVQRGDFDGDGETDDCRYTVSYAFANRRVIQPRITLVIYDYNCDLVIDKVEVTQ